jgi:hypothetical protein
MTALMNEAAIYLSFALQAAAHLFMHTGGWKEPEHFFAH